MTTVITGTSQGLGKELAAQYTPVDRLIVLNRTKTAQAEEIIVNFAKEASVRAAAHTLLTKLKGNEAVCFILNAAVYGDDEKITDSTPQGLGELFYVNVFSQLSLVETLLENGMQVKLIAVSSGMGSISSAYYSTHFAYAGSKATLNLSIRLLRRAHRQLDYFIVDPGWMRTSMGGDAAPADPKQIAAVIASAARNAQNWNRPNGMYYASTGEIVNW